MAQFFTVNGFTHSFVHFSFQKKMVSRGRPVEIPVLSDRMCVLHLYIKIVLSYFGLQCIGLVLCKSFTVPNVTDLNFLYCPYIP